MIRVVSPRGVEPAFHIARFMPPAAPEPGWSALQGPPLLMPRPQHPDIVQELYLLLIDQPQHRYQEPVVYLPAGTGDVCVPWQQERRTGLVLPARVVVEREWEEQWPVLVMLTPGRAGLPGTAADMAHTAWAVLGSFDPDLVARIAATLSFRLDILGPFSPFAAQVLCVLDLPPGPRARVIQEASSSPVFDPRCLRWIVQEVAAATAAGVWGSATTVPTADDPAGRELLGRVLFSAPVGRRDGRRSVAELLRAIWLLHEGFDQRSEDVGVTAHDQVLSVSGVLGYSQRPRFAWADRLNQWRLVWDTDDQHPTITQNSSATGQRHRPSDLRQALVDRAGLTVDELMTGGLGLAAWYFVTVAQGQVPVHRPEVIRASVTERGRVAQRFIDCVGQHMTATLQTLGARVLDELDRGGGQYQGLGTTPTHDGQALADAPLLELDDGSWTPVSLDLLVDRIVALPRAVAVSDGRFGHHRTVTGLLGYMFEAAVTTLMQRLQARHQILTEADIAAALGRRDGGDGIIGYDTNYLVVEASIQTLPPSVAQGSVEAIRTRCRQYHRKADQANKTAADLHRLTAHYGTRTPTTTTSLVITDIPLTLNPVLANELRALNPDRNPKFVCSLEEFERLIELGVIGWDVPSAVTNWQARPLDVPLTDQLARMGDIFERNELHWRFDLQNWLDNIPIDGPEAA